MSFNINLRKITYYGNSYKIEEKLKELIDYF